MTAWLDAGFATSLERAVERGALEGLSVERRRSAAFLWDERLTVDAREVTLQTLRSIRDRSGEPIGLMAAGAPPDALVDIARRLPLIETPPPPPRRSGPSEVRWCVRVTLDGAARELFFSTEAGVGADLGQVVRAFSALEKVARQSPVRTLQLTAEMSEPPWDDPTAVPVKLLFQNRGAEGFWIREPATFPVRAPLPQLARATDGAPDVDEDELPHEVTPSLARHELCEVICMVERRVPRDVTPMLSPTRLRLEPVTAATDDPAAVVWIDGQGSLTRHFTVSIPPVMRPSRDAPLLLRATWSSYVGEELFEGRPRMRGCVFSDELTLRGA